jgi:uncharacterized protein YjiS (DUF1127 family)
VFLTRLDPVLTGAFCLSGCVLAILLQRGDTVGPIFAVTHRTPFTVRCGYLLPDVFLDARRGTMMRRGSTMLVVGSVNSPFRGMTKLRTAHLGHLRHRFFQWRRHVHLCDELMSLSDEELRDIGLSRTKAEIRASKVFWLP